MTPHFPIWSFGPKIESVDGICHQTDSISTLRQGLIALTLGVSIHRTSVDEPTHFFTLFFSISRFSLSMENEKTDAGRDG